jgi:hypothetical protein
MDRLEVYPVAWIGAYKMQEGIGEMDSADCHYHNVGVQVSFKVMHSSETGTLEFSHFKVVTKFGGDRRGGLI